MARPSDAVRRLRERINKASFERQLKASKRRERRRRLREKLRSKTAAPRIEAKATKLELKRLREDVADTPVPGTQAAKKAARAARRAAGGTTEAVKKTGSAVEGGLSSADAAIERADLVGIDIDQDGEIESDAPVDGLGGDGGADLTFGSGADDGGRDGGMSFLGESDARDDSFAFDVLGGDDEDQDEPPRYF